MWFWLFLLKHWRVFTSFNFVCVCPFLLLPSTQFSIAIEERIMSNFMKNLYANRIFVRSSCFAPNLISIFIGISFKERKSVSQCNERWSLWLILLRLISILSSRLSTTSLIYILYERILFIFFFQHYKQRILNVFFYK